MSAIYESQKRKQDTSFNRLKFPNEDLTHFCTLIFTEYNRKAVPNLRAKKPARFENIPTNAIILPIPANLQEVFGVNYQGSELGSAVGGGASIFGEMQGGKSLGDSGLNLSNIGKKIAATSLGNGATVRAAEKYFGEVFNPHLTTVFQGLQLRNHSFSWRLSPVSEDESLRLKEIIDTIRYKMLPPRKDSLILGYPAEVDVQFYGDAYGIYPLFRSVVTNMTVNHAAAGTPVFFGQTGMPAEIELTLQFQETEVVTRNDIPVPQIGNPPSLTDTEGSF